LVTGRLINEVCSLETAIARSRRAEIGEADRQRESVQQDKAEGLARD
jgi:hypothetical protein